MSDGRVQIKFQTDTSALDASEGKLNQLGGSVKNLAGALGLLKVGAAAFSMISDSIGDAVSRVDTMNQYPKMLEQMGFSATEAESSINRLSDGIQGLPTRLDDVVSTTQRFTTTFRDVDKATETTLALNNALLASGAGAQEAASATDQYAKMMSSGKVEMDAWNNLSENMNYALSEVSEQLGYSSENTWELYDALKSGDVTLDEFNNAMIEASTASGGFAEVALTASEGIATSWANIRTAVVTGVANIIQALDDLILDLTGKNIAKHFDTIKVAVADIFKVIVSAIRNAKPYIESAIALFKRFTPVLEALQDIWSTTFKALKGDVDAKELVKAFQNYYSELYNVLSDIGKDIKDWIFDSTQSQSWEEVAEWVFSKVGEGFKDFTSAVGDVGSALKEWIFSSTGSQSWGEVAQWIYSQIGSAWDSAKAFLGNVGSSIKTWVFESVGADSWAEVAEVIFSAIGTAWDSAIDFLGNVSEKIRTWIFDSVGADSWADVASKIIEMIASSVSGAVSAWQSITTKIRTSLATYLSSEEWDTTAESIITGIANAVGTLGNIVGRIAGAIVAALAPQLSEQGYDESGQAIINGLVSALWDAPRQIALALVDGLTGGLIGELANLDLSDIFNSGAKGSSSGEAPQGTGGFGAGSSQANNPLDGMDEVVQTSMDDIVAIIRTGYQSINTETNTFIATMNSTIASNLQHMESEVHSGLNAISSLLGMMLNSYNNTVIGGMNAIIATLNSYNEGAYNAGVQLAEGFRSGLASRRNSIINTATGIANAATAAINKALVVKSPSRKGIYSGKMLGEGVEVGMENEIPNIERMATRLADSAIPDIKPIDMNTALNLPYYRSANNSPVSATGKASNDSKLADLLTRIADKDTYVVLDDGTLVGKIAPKIDRHLGGVAKNKQRYGGATI